MYDAEILDAVPSRVATTDDVIYRHCRAIMLTHFGAEGRRVEPTLGGLTLEHIETAHADHCVNNRMNVPVDDVECIDLRV
jgi:hypothetical protein